MNLFKIYNNLLTTNPLTTKMVTSGFMFGLGDVVAQTAIEKHDKFDYKRTAKFFLLGSVFAAPVLHKWYGFLPQFCERNIFSKYQNMSQLSKTLISMSIDQTVFAASFTAYFFMVINYIEYQQLDKGIQSIKDKLPEALIANWKLWPAAQMINFSIVPLPYRVLFANCVGFVWNIYLSYLQHRQ